jgi:hypothetical protein
MFVARWIIDAKLGHKDDVKAITKKWQDEIGERVGMKRAASRILTGSIGAAECRFEFEQQFASLAEMEKAWVEMGKLPSHAKFGKELEPHIVSGTNRWEVLRIIET